MAPTNDEWETLYHELKTQKNKELDELEESKNIELEALDRKIMSLKDEYDLLKKKYDRLHSWLFIKSKMEDTLFAWMFIDDSLCSIHLTTRQRWTIVVKSFLSDDKNYSEFLKLFADLKKDLTRDFVEDLFINSIMRLRTRLNIIINDYTNSEYGDFEFFNTDILKFFAEKILEIEISNEK